MALLDHPPDWVVEGRIAPQSGGGDAFSSPVTTPRYTAQSTTGRVQVLLEDGWHESPQDEVKQIFDNIAGGQSKFTIATERGTCLVDLAGPEGPVQTDARAQKGRAMRILEAEPGDAAPRAGNQEAASTQAAAGTSSPSSRAEEVRLQSRYGPQSKRGEAPQHQLEVIAGDPHAVRCFAELAENEVRRCGEWAVFYHSYSFAALIYEVHAAVARLLFGFASDRSPLPRLLVNEFAQTPDAASLITRFNKEFASKKKDHNPEYRKVAISAMCSLVTLGPEASTPIVFMFGYSEKDVSFRGVLENLLESCHVPKGKVKKLANGIIALCELHGLDASQFGGNKCESGKPGHLLQIFIKRRLVDDVAYAAKPYGGVDEERQPISKWLDGDTCTNYGQARVVAHPKTFLSEKCVRMHVASADPKFHANRPKFQEELTKLLRGALGDSAAKRERAATALYGGVLPDWWKEDLAN